MWTVRTSAQVGQNLYSVSLHAQSGVYPAIGTTIEFMSDLEVVSTPSVMESPVWVPSEVVQIEPEVLQPDVVITQPELIAPEVVPIEPEIVQPDIVVTQSESTPSEVAEAPVSVVPPSLENDESVTVSEIPVNAPLPGENSVQTNKQNSRKSQRPKPKKGSKPTIPPAAS